MKSHKPNYYIMPQSKIVGNTLEIWYEVKPNNPKEHLRMHDEDVNYIHGWLNRFTTDISAKQLLDTPFYNLMTTPTKEMPRSSYEKKEDNSVLSYASGLVSNRLRNPSEDYTKKQLLYIKRIFELISVTYEHTFLKKDLGYDIVTGVLNEKPLMIKFKEVK